MRIFYFCNFVVAILPYHKNYSIMEKSYFGLFAHTYLLEDDDKKSGSCEFVVCISNDRGKLEHYADVLNSAEGIKKSIMPRNCIHATYLVKSLTYVL